MSWGVSLSLPIIYQTSQRGFCFQILNNKTPEQENGTPAIKSWGLALFAGQQDRKAALLTLSIFPFALVSGAGLALFIQPPTWIATINLALIPILGLAVASAFACPAALTIILVTAIGLLHGLANGSEITAPMSAWRFIPGMATAAMLILTYGIGVVRSLEKPWARIAVRVAGSWIAAAGIMVCAFKL